MECHDFSDIGGIGVQDGGGCMWKTRRKKGEKNEKQRKAPMRREREERARQSRK
jgi:hypothetical protein